MAAPKRPKRGARAPLVRGDAHAMALGRLTRETARSEVAMLGLEGAAAKWGVLPGVLARLAGVRQP